MVFKDFVNACIFVHDDVQGDLRTNTGEMDWDQFGTNPFFLGARSVVVDTLQGFGEPYLDYLSELDCLPQNIIIPERKASSLLENLLSDTKALQEFRVIARQRRLDVSGFYCDHDKDFATLLNYISEPEYSPRLHVSKDVFMYANDKIRMHTHFLNMRIPVPDGLVCTSMSELREFFNFNHKRGFLTLVKRLHWQNLVIQDETHLQQLDGKLVFPILAERIYSVKYSPVSHHIAWNSKSEHLFTVQQIIENWRHYGNELPHRLSDKMMLEIIDYSMTIIRGLPSYTGVCGIDFIVTPEDEVMVVDFNPRFNSSTYPFYFLQRKGILLDSIYARFRFARVPVPDLSSVFLDPDFVPFNPDSAEGVLLMSPVFSFSKNVVIRFLYLTVSKTSAGLDAHENNLFRILDRKRQKLN